MDDLKIPRKKISREMSPMVDKDGVTAIVGTQSTHRETNPVAAVTPVVCNLKERSDDPTSEDLGHSSMATKRYGDSRLYQESPSKRSLVKKFLGSDFYQKNNNGSEMFLKLKDDMLGSKKSDDMTCERQDDGDISEPEGRFSPANSKGGSILHCSNGFNPASLKPYLEVTTEDKDGNTYVLHRKADHKGNVMNVEGSTNAVNKESFEKIAGHMLGLQGTKDTHGFGPILYAHMYHMYTPFLELVHEHCRMSKQELFHQTYMEMCKDFDKGNRFSFVTKFNALLGMLSVDVYQGQNAGKTLGGTHFQWTPDAQTLIACMGEDDDRKPESRPRQDSASNLNLRFDRGSGESEEAIHRRFQSTDNREFRKIISNPYTKPRTENFVQHGNSSSEVNQHFASSYDSYPASHNGNNYYGEFGIV